MRKIPESLREEMSKDIFYKKCCVADEFCLGRIEFHHNLIYAGRQVNEKWCILPVCKYHHDREKDKYIGELLDHVMLNRATDDDLRHFSKAFDYLELKNKLNEKYNYKN